MTPSLKGHCSKEKPSRAIQTFRAGVCCCCCCCTSAGWVPLVLHVSKIKTSRWSSEPSIKVKVPREIGWEQNHLSVQGLQATPGIPCELVGSGQCFCCPVLQLSIIFSSKWQNMQIKDSGCEPGILLFPATIYPLVCNTPHGRTTSKSLMLQVFLPILGSVGDHILRPNVHHQGLGAVCL